MATPVSHARALLLLGTLFAGCAIQKRDSPATAQAPAGAAAAEELGSLRNARVAIERGPDAPPLTYFARSLSAEHVQEAARIAPSVKIVVGLSPAEALARATEAHGIDAAYARPEFLRAATNLVWVQTQSAGVENLLAIPELADNDRIVLTNFRGVHGPAIADHAFALLLALTRDLPFHIEGRSTGRWVREGSGVLQPFALEGKTLLVVGLGGIGSEIAERGRGFGMRVIATRRGDDPAPEWVARVGKPDQLMAMLPEADVVALAVPLTDETRGMIDARAIAAMKRGTFLVNIARGQLVDTDAMVAALKSGQLGGAALDVTDPEPLPPGHELWKLPNVVITPHNASVAGLTTARGAGLFLENLRRFHAGEPLYNVVDKKVGY